jgi:F0F1-type ATP synthase membrane subunit b/b'
MIQPNYTKDPRTGAVIFDDENAYANRKKVIKKQKLLKDIENDTKTVINSLRNEISELKVIVASLMKNKEK